MPHQKKSICGIAGLAAALAMFPPLMPHHSRKINLRHCWPLKCHTQKSNLQHLWFGYALPAALAMFPPLMQHAPKQSTCGLLLAVLLQCHIQNNNHLWHGWFGSMFPAVWQHSFNDCPPLKNSNLQCCWFGSTTPAVLLTLLPLTLHPKKTIYFWHC